SADMNSFNHYAYGAIGDWLYRKVAGIELDEHAPAFKHFTIQPHIGAGLDWVEATYKSRHGEIKSAWRKSEAGGIELEVTVPANTTARVRLLGAKIGNVKESDTPISQADGIISFTDPGDSVDILIGSGAYQFTF